MKTVTAYKCNQCGHVMYPYHDRCLNCNGREFEEVAPEGQAKLLTYTIINELPWGLDERARILGIVEFKNGVKAMGLLKVDEPKIGMKLTPGWDAVRVIGGEKVFGLCFVKS